MAEETKTPQVPEIPSGLDGGLRRFLEAIKGILVVREGLKGDALDANVTYRDLINAGIATSDRYVAPNNGTTPVDPAAVTDSTPAPNPQNVKIDAAVESIILTWDVISASNFAYVEVWRSLTNQNTGTSPIGTTTGNIFVDKTVSTSQGSGYYYWLRSVSTSGTKGSFNTTPYRATATVLPSTAITAVKNLPQFRDIPGQPFYYIDTDVTVNGVQVPKGTYMWTAVIADATIESAKIKSLTVDKLTASTGTFDALTANSVAAGMLNATSAYVKSANIVELAAEKITTGTLAAGTEITVGANSVVISGNGNIRTYDTSGTVNPKYTEMNSGNVVAYEYIPTVGYQPFRSLTRLESGMGAPNNVEVVLPGHWSKMPVVMVSPSDLTIYSAGSSGANQRMNCFPSGLNRLSTDPATENYYKWKFTPKAELTVAAGSVAYSPNYIAANITVNRGSNATYPLQYIAATNYCAELPYPANTTAASFTVSCNIWEWVDFEGSNYVVYTGAIYCLFQINIGAGWTTIYTSPSFNSGASRSAFDMPGPVNRSFSFSPTPVNVGGQFRVVFVSSGGTADRGSVSQALYDNLFKYGTPEVRLYEALLAASLTTTSATSLASGTLNWIAIG